MSTNNPPVQDRTVFYTDLAFMAKEQKNQLWIAQNLFYAKNGGAVRFLSSHHKNLYRKLEKGEINADEYKELFDPTTPSGDGGKAEYMASDWKTCPIDAHLDNIVTTKMDKVGSENQLQVNQIDKFAKTQKQKDTEKILYQREFRALINSVHEELHLPPVREGQSPYSYVQAISVDGGKEAGITDMNTLLDYIKSKITDSEDLALYEAYIYRGNIEIALELGIQHYLLNINKYNIHAEEFYRDIRHHNRFCGRWYVDDTSGRGQMEYIEPDELYTSPFKRKNGEDIVFWYREKAVTFAEFIRMFGKKLGEPELKEVFEQNKMEGGKHGMEWSSAKGSKGSNAKIMIGYFSILTQDADNFSEKLVDGKLPTWKPQELSWEPHKNTPYQYREESVKKIYNVWYSCYYVPPPSAKVSSNTQADWAWQSQFIFDIKKDTDMYRYGVDMRYAKSQLVIWKDDTRMSFTDIKESFMTKIRIEWFNFQNCLLNNVDGTMLAQEFLGAVANNVDDANKNGKGDGVSVQLRTMRQIKQGGMAFAKMTDSNGNMLTDPSKFVIPIKNGKLESAEKHLNMIIQLYQLMTTALAQNDVSEGQDAKPRVAVAGIQAALASSREGIWFVEKPARECLVMFGERCVQHLLTIVKEKKKYGFKKRFEELQSVIGKANSQLLESLEDLKPEEIGMTVTLEDTHANQQYVIELANKMADDGEVGRDVVGLVMNQVATNYKYAYVLLMLASKERQREKAHEKELQQQYIMQQKDADLKIAIALQGAKTQGKDQNIVTEGKVQGMIEDMLNRKKHQDQLEKSDKVTQNRMIENEQKANLEKEKTAQEPHDS